MSRGSSADGGELDGHLAVDTEELLEIEKALQAVELVGMEDTPRNMQSTDIERTSSDTNKKSPSLSARDF